MEERTLAWMVKLRLTHGSNVKHRTSLIPVACSLKVAVVDVVTPLGVDTRVGGCGGVAST